MPPFVLGLWPEKDTDMFHCNAKQYALMGNATGSITAKVGTKGILYCSFLLCDKIRNNEPLANIELFTDSHDELPIRHCLSQFILDEKRKFGHISNAVPVLFTCDICRAQFLNLLSVISIMNLLKNIFLGLAGLVMDVLLHQL